MDKPPHALPTFPQARQRQQENQFKEILPVSETTGIFTNTNGGNYRPLWAHSLDPMDMIVSGWFMSLFQAWHPASMMAS